MKLRKNKLKAAKKMAEGIIDKKCFDYLEPFVPPIESFREILAIFKVAKLELPGILEFFKDMGFEYTEDNIGYYLRTRPFNNKELSLAKEKLKQM